MPVLACHLEITKRKNYRMPRFSQKSFSQLSTCHIDLQVIMYEAIKTIDFTILKGFRNQQDQEDAFNSGASKKHWPHGNHNHFPSLAVDIYPYPLDWKDEERFVYFAGFIMAIAVKLKEEGKITHSSKWGGDWDKDYQVKDEKFRDYGHFELMAT